MTATVSGKGTPREPIRLGSVVKWMRERLQSVQDTRALPPLPKPPRARLQAPRRGWFAGWWSARLAAASGVGLDEFLRHRVSRYLSALPVPPERLPVSIAVDGGRIATAPRDEAAPPAWLDGYLRANGSASVQSDVLLLQAELARAATRIADQRARVEAARADAEAATRAPSIAELDGGGAEALGRPPVPLPWTPFIVAFGVALLLAEAWQLAIPVLAGAGVDASEIPASFARNPAGVVLGFAFALGAAVSLFFFVDVAIRHAVRLVSELSAPRRAGWTVAAAIAALSFAGAVSWSIAGLRAGAAAVEYEKFTLFLLALALPITTSCLLQLGRAMHGRRRDALAAAVAWDQVHYRALSEWSRKAGALSVEERQLAALEEDRAAVQRRMRALRQRAQLAERWAAETSDGEAQELERICHVIGSSLELDRYELVRQLRARGAPVTHARPAAAPEERSLGLAG